MKYRMKKVHLTPASDKMPAKTMFYLSFFFLSRSKKREEQQKSLIYIFQS